MLDNKINNLTAKDVMRVPVTIDGNRTVAHAQVLMQKNKTACLCVTSGGRIIGLLHGEEIYPENLKLTAQDIIDPCKMSVVSRSDLSFVLKLMMEENLTNILVMDKGKCVGVITKETLKQDGYLQ